MPKSSITTPEEGGDTPTSPVVEVPPAPPVLVADTLEEWKHFEFPLKGGKTYTADRLGPLKEEMLKRKLNAAAVSTIVGVDLSWASEIVSFENWRGLWAYVFAPGLSSGKDDIDWQGYEGGEVIAEVDSPLYDWFLLTPPAAKQ